MRVQIRTYILVSAIAVLTCFAQLTDAFACGRERWLVKTGADADAAQVDLSAIHRTRVSAMRSWPAPNHLPRNRRVAPYELQVWSVDATITSFKRETDDDIHLVLRDESGHTMIAEIPDPKCVDPSSPFLEEITATREAFVKAHPPSDQFQTVNLRVRVIGVGFFDFQHGQMGVAPNAIEIHPVLEILPLAPVPPHRE